jgi:nucleoside-diphosphate-sugar epimerase
MRKILVTGGAGNVGSALVKGLLGSPENKVIVVDNLSTGSRSKLPFFSNPNFTFIKADINDYKDIAGILISQKFDYVFHYAAMVGVKRTLENPIQVLKDIEGIYNILLLSKNTGVKRVFYSSSSEVYGEPVEFPQNEHTTPLNSRLPYAIVKNVGEAYLRSFHQEYNLDYTIFRFFNTYGPNQSADFVIAKFLDAALLNRNITIYGDGSQTRTFCYVEDNIEATLKCLYEGYCTNDVLNVGNDKETTILELAEKIIAITGSSSKIVHLPPLKEGDMTRRKPDNSKMLSILKKPLITLDEGLKMMIKERMELESIKIQSLS